VQPVQVAAVPLQVSSPSQTSVGVAPPQAFEPAQLAALRWGPL
jgi:hypothetical protein